MKPSDESPGQIADKVNECFSSVGIRRVSFRTKRSAVRKIGLFQQFISSIFFSRRTDDGFKMTPCDQYRGLSTH
ncbi:hypothetical protein BMS3Bbin04_00845 [bacterium BMS3Bbin04]|nr:hypothetical protein BMS3Bbin04_00845 [bacterium BMS3Bbin04]